MNKDKIANPTKFYQHPNDVIKDHSLSDIDKIKSLENWLDDIKLKLIAEDENMGLTSSQPQYYINEIQTLLAKARNKN